MRPISVIIFFDMICSISSFSLSQTRNNAARQKSLDSKDNELLRDKRTRFDRHEDPFKDIPFQDEYIPGESSPNTPNRLFYLIATLSKLQNAADEKSDVERTLNNQNPSSQLTAVADQIQASDQMLEILLSATNPVADAVKRNLDLENLLPSYDCSAYAYRCLEVWNDLENLHVELMLLQQTLSEQLVIKDRCALMRSFIEQLKPELNVLQQGKNATNLKNFVKDIHWLKLHLHSSLGKIIALDSDQDRNKFAAIMVRLHNLHCRLQAAAYTDSAQPLDYEPEMAKWLHGDTIHTVTTRKTLDHLLVTYMDMFFNTLAYGLTEFLDCGNEVFQRWQRIMSDTAQEMERWWPQCFHDYSIYDTS